MKLSTIAAAASSALALVIGSNAVAAPTTYKIDPSHTYPSFEADHFGISVWRGKFNQSSGSVILDMEAKTGSLEIEIMMDSVDFGHKKMNEHAKAEDILDVAKYPKAIYKSSSITFKDGVPVEVPGELTMHGVTKPVTLKINRFKCIMHPMLKREVCGADASAEFKRSDFGINFALPNFSPEVKLAIQVEAVKQDAVAK